MENNDLEWWEKHLEDLEAGPERHKARIPLVAEIITQIRDSLNKNLTIQK